MNDMKDYLRKALSVAQAKVLGYQLVVLNSNKTHSSEKLSSHNRYESLERQLIWLQKVIFWHDPIKSAMFMASIVSSFM